MPPASCLQAPIWNGLACSHRGRALAVAASIHLASITAYSSESWSAIMLHLYATTASGFSLCRVLPRSRASSGESRLPSSSCLPLFFFFFDSFSFERAREERE
ncbi:putative proline-rich receptor-like protein kinase PERK3 [Iris pallida]|uniref:Proline-rich receptor-like protein kinase PERK3 n=1 Tax=Iris pallida TaxID=29817 RepID=A0AAX6HJM9_IRIPA|nr:putative proline-rich receptor-like protein kinase PERK3 [Iris pallida]